MDHVRQQVIYYLKVIYYLNKLINNMKDKRIIRFIRSQFLDNDCYLTGLRE